MPASITLLHAGPSHLQPKKPFLGCSFDPTVPVAMDRPMHMIATAVASGAYFYVCGQVEASKALALAQRFNDLYGLDVDRFKRSRAKGKGSAVFQLHFWPLAGTTTLAWYLLRTEGEHPLLSIESWRDAREASSRIEWPFWYELVRMPVPYAHRKKLAGPHGKPVKEVSWTWRIKGEVKEDLLRDIRRAITNPKALAKVVDALKRAAGFRQIRQDVKDLHGYIWAQWQKHRVAEDQRIALPQTIRWVTIRKCRREPLSVLVYRATTGCASWFPESK